MHAAAMPSRRKQQKPRHVDAEDSDDVDARPPLRDDDEHDDTDAGKSLIALSAEEAFILKRHF